MLTHARLLELVHYDPKTGVFTWKVARRGYRGIRAGDRLGSLQPEGYLGCMILGKNYRLHRLAFFYMTGRWPIEVDHRNRKGADNRWRNLREATRGQNGVNSNRPNKTGFRGVYALRRQRDGTQRYAACVKKDGLKTYLGVFDTAKAAHTAYVAAAKAAHGEFAEHL